MAKINGRISTPKLKRDRVSSENTMRNALKQQDLYKKFSEEISRKLRSISTDSTTGTEHSELCSNVILDTAKEVLNVNPPRRRSPWFDGECAEAICAKNEARWKKLQRETRAADDHYKEMRRVANTVERSATMKERSCMIWRILKIGMKYESFTKNWKDRYMVLKPRIPLSENLKQTTKYSPSFFVNV